MNRLLDTLRALRAPDGCPWDREQTHESLRPHLLEEAAEAVDALASGDDSQIVEELGDVLLHVGFHAVIAEEGDRWDFSAIERTLVEKLVRRHPHVFGDADAADAAAVEATWARVKAEERGADASSAAARVPRSLPALARAAAMAKATDDDGEADALSAVADGRVDDRSLAAALYRLAVLVAERGHDPETLLRDEVRRVQAHNDATTDAGS